MMQVIHSCLFVCFWAQLWQVIAGPQEDNDTASKALPQPAMKGQAYSTKGLQKVLDRLVAGMDTRMPAPRDLGDPEGIVWFDLTIQKFENFDQATGIAGLSGWFYLKWNDERLRFNGSDVGQGWASHRDHIAIPSNLVWKPDIKCYEASEESYSDASVIVYDENRLQRDRVNVWWIRPFVVHAHCPSDLRDFPFDAQHCRLSYGPWDATAAHYRFFSSKFSYGTNLTSEEWTVTVDSIRNVTQQFPTGIYEEVHVDMTFTRNSHYYIANAILPLSLLVVVSLLAMWLPVEGGSGERIGFSVIIVLTVVATTFVTSGMRPATQEDTWLDQLQGLCLFLTILPLFESGLIVWLQHQVERVTSSVLKEDMATHRCPSVASSSGLTRAKSLKSLTEGYTYQDIQSVKERAMRSLEATDPGNQASIWVVHVLVSLPTPSGQAATPKAIDDMFKHLYTLAVAFIGWRMYSSIPDRIMHTEAASAKVILHATTGILGLAFVATLGWFCVIPLKLWQRCWRNSQRFESNGHVKSNAHDVEAGSHPEPLSPGSNPEPARADSATIRHVGQSQHPSKLISF